MRAALKTSTQSIRVAHKVRLPSLALLGGCVAALYVAGCSGQKTPVDPPFGAGDDGLGGGGKGAGGGALGGSSGTAGSATAQSGGTAGRGGTSGNAGSGIGGTGGSNAGSGPRAGSGGSSSGSGGTAGGGAAGVGPGGLGGKGGVSNGGAGAVGGSATGGSSGVAQPSAGCGKGGRPSGGKVEVANTSLYMFPAGYDGTKPYPLLIALHACGNPNSEFVTLTNGTGFETDYVRSFTNTPDSGQCWSNYAGDVARITAQYDEVMANYCIDQSRVFAIAHSSGAQMLVNILSHKTDAQHLNLKGISPVAADPYDVAVPMPVLYIDGKMDNQRSADSAKNTVAKFRTSNSCADTSQPYTSVMGCKSTDSGNPTVDPGCIKYDSCAVPTIWCSHNDPSYSGTEHGVPCFAMTAMLDFFTGL